MLEPEFDREQLRKFNKKGYRSVAARYAQSAELILIQLEAELKRRTRRFRRFGSTHNASLKEYSAQATTGETPNGTTRAQITSMPSGSSTRSLAATCSGSTR